MEIASVGVIDEVLVARQFWTDQATAHDGASAENPQRGKRNPPVCGDRLTNRDEKAREGIEPSRSRYGLVKASVPCFFTSTA